MATYQFDGSFGGALASDSPTYVERQADADLKQCLQDGKFCYVFNARQMGKSSLKARTIHDLKLQGTACVDIDLTGLGTDRVNAEQFYYSIADEIASKIQLPNEVDEADLRRDLQSELETCWDRYSQFSEVKRFTKFIDTVILERIDSKIVIFVDEIDKVISLDSFTDDFFGTIRYFAEQGIENPKYQRLSFVLIGVATPIELMKDKERTPLNIGKAINLCGLNLNNDLSPLSSKLINRIDSELIIRDILDWTGGQPFLTQKICELVVESPNEITVEQLVSEKIVSNWKSQDQPVHFGTISSRILANESRASSLLEEYRKILINSSSDGIADSDNGIDGNGSQEQQELKLSGLVVERNGKLQVYNLIYKKIFNLEWVNENFKIIPYSSALLDWIDSGKQKDLLLCGEALEEAIKWRDKNSDKLSYEYREFLSVSKERESRQNFKKITRDHEIATLLHHCEEYQSNDLNDLSVMSDFVAVPLQPL